MTQEAKETENLSPAVIVTMGDAARTVGELLASRYPTDLYPCSAEQANSANTEFDGLIEKINQSARRTDAVTELPAVVVIADVADADAVLRVLDAVRSGKTMVKPRVWPAFITGHPTELGAFDSALDDRGTGSCDLVLIMTGATSQEASADALAAWLHVKMPAPASVLAELPDSQGRICRYVALGCRAVDPAARNAGITGGQTTISINTATAAEQVSADLALRAQADGAVVAANAAATALAQAAQQYSATDLLRCESELTVALTEVDRKLGPALSTDLPQIVADVVARLSAGTAPESTPTERESVADSVQPVPSVPAGDVAGRTQTVSQLVLLASKGGLTKMFSRNRMATVAETIGPLAQADIAATVRAVLSQLDKEVPALVDAEAQRLADVQNADREAAAQEAQQAESTTWNQAVSKARGEVGLWPNVDVAGISRSWGGGVPAARQYIVGSARALRLLTEDDAFMPVVDLRAERLAGAGVAGADQAGVALDEIDLRDQSAVSGGRAIVLLAQYGLPLAALR